MFYSFTGSLPVSLSLAQKLTQTLWVASRACARFLSTIAPIETPRTRTFLTTCSISSHAPAARGSPLAALWTPSPARSLATHHPTPATQVPHTQLSMGIEFTLQSFLLFLRKLASFFHKRWDQLTRRLWYMFASLRSRFPSRHLKKGDEIRRSIQSRPAKCPPTVICASRFPPPLTPIIGDDAPIASPAPISTRIHQPIILSPGEISYETHETHGTDRLDVDGNFLEEGGSISRSPNSPGHHDEPESIHVDLQGTDQGGFISNSPVTPSRPPSQHSYRPAAQYGGCRPPSEHSYRSPPNLNSAEVVARGYLHVPPSTRPSSPILSVRRRSNRRLCPMAATDRYGKQSTVVVDDALHSHVSLPVTIQFVR